MSDGPTPIEIDLTTNEIYPIELTPDVLAACEEESLAYVEAQRWKWLESTYTLQREAFKMQLPLAPNTNYLADYVVVNHSALVSEASELLAEFGWKSWAQPRGWVNRENALKEAVDVAHFLANILCSIGVTDEEWERAYQAKQAVNRQRQRDGYDGVAGKCPECKRSYDDGIECVPGGTAGLVTNGAGQSVMNVDGQHWCAYM